MTIVWLKFVICACLILFAGKRVARYADIIAYKTGLSRLWIGVLLVAVATSLPEMFTGVGSVTLLDAPDLAVGNLMGANAYNLLNIALLDVLHRGQPLLSAVSPGHILVAALSLVPIIIAVIGIVVSDAGFHAWSVANVGIFSFAIFVSYLIAAKIIYNLEKKKTREEKEVFSGDYGDIRLGRAVFHYAIAAGIIVLSGIWLAYIGKELASLLSLGESFIGMLFIGFATTLPEITVSVSALFIGAKDIAIANMFGSNLFNIALIFLDDTLYGKAPILQSVSQNNIFPAITVMAMTAVIIAAMALRSGRRILGISWYVPVMIAIFMAGAYVNFKMGIG